jgi:hypothetical protein
MFSKGLEYILREMCSRVGADYDKMDFNKENWFWEYQWTREEEEDFIKWLAKKIRKDRKVRTLFWTDRKVTEKEAEMGARMFVFNYGWKLKEEK